MYKFTQQCHDRIGDALAPVGPEAREGLLHDVWKIFGVAWEARVGQKFPSQVAYAQGETLFFSFLLHFSASNHRFSSPHRLS